MKLNIGCGQDIILGYRNVDISRPEPPLENVEYVQNYYELNCSAGEVEKIRCLYGLAQVPPEHVYITLQSWHQWLKEGGEVYIELYDVYLISNDFINGFIDIKQYADLIYGQQKRTAFTIDAFSDMIKEIGYKIIDAGLTRHSFYMTLTK